jgi:hypothetical protein
VQGKSRNLHGRSNDHDIAGWGRALTFLSKKDIMQTVMTFLNPFVLAGLAAAAIPIIIHLLNLRKLKTIEFSSLRFLKELQKTKMRRVKIRQWLLLALRTLLIIALVLAFARPTLKGSLAGIPLSGESHAKTTMVILLDDSPSMAVRNERGLLFTQAKHAAQQILDLVKEGDEAYLIRLSEIRHREGFGPVRAGESLNKNLDQMTLSQETAPYRDFFRAAARVMEESRNFNQEIYLITDAQSTQFVTEQSDSTALLHERARVYLVDVGSGQVDNAGLQSVELKSRIIAQHKPVNMQAVVRNFGTAALRNSILSAYLDGRRVVQHSLDIMPGSSGTADFSLVPKRRGIIAGYLQLEDDALEIDNRRFFVLNVPDKIRILLAGGSPQDTRLAAIALKLETDTTTAGLFSVQEIAETELSATDLNKYDVLFFCGLRDFTETEADRIAGFANSGRGIVLFPGKETSIPNYNETILARMGIPPAQPASGQTSGETPVTDTERSFVSFGLIDFAHPLFSGLFDRPIGGRSATPAVESPRVYTHIIPSVGPRDHTIISLSNGTGFLTEYVVGTGRVLLCSVETDLTWSDFPVKGLWVPFLHRAAAYLATQDQPFESFVAGNEITFRTKLQAWQERDVFTVKSPSGIEERIVPQTPSTSGTVTFETANTSEVGIYELQRTLPRTAQSLPEEQGQTVLQAVAVNVDAAESDTRQINDEDLEEFWKRVGITHEQTRHLSVAARIETEVLESRFGVELWKYCVVFAVLFAFAEMAVGREPKSGG